MLRTPEDRYAPRALEATRPRHTRKAIRTALGTVWLALLALPGCNDGGAPLSPLAAEGRATYMSVCIACHNADPTREGALGPALAGSSLELLEARVVRGEYPPGYTPQRSSAAMPAFPHLADQIDALHAYLNATN